MINRKFFFDHAREILFGGKLSTSQVAGITAILDAWEEEYAAKDDRWLAYALGTTHHETDQKMQPIDEYGTTQYFFKRYDKAGSNPALARRLGNTHAGDGAKFHGRGYVQITGRSNYEKMSTITQRNLLDNPDIALDPPIAAKIMFVGMCDGMFTGKSFDDCFTCKPNGLIDKDNWLGARSIINGTDKAANIAQYGKKYYSCISHTL
jgi:putative chitinase